MDLKADNFRREMIDVSACVFVLISFTLYKIRLVVDTPIYSESKGHHRSWLFSETTYISIFYRFFCDNHRIGYHCSCFRYPGPFSESIFDSYTFFRRQTL